MSHLFTSANSFIKVFAITWELVVLKCIAVSLAWRLVKGFKKNLWEMVYEQKKQ